MGVDPDNCLLGLYATAVCVEDDTRRAAFIVCNGRLCELKHLLVASFIVCRVGAVCFGARINNMLMGDGGLGGAWGFGSALPLKHRGWEQFQASDWPAASWQLRELLGLVEGNHLSVVVWLGGLVEASNERASTMGNGGGGPGSAAAPRYVPLFLQSRCRRSAAGLDEPGGEFGPWWAISKLGRLVVTGVW